MTLKTFLRTGSAAAVAAVLALGALPSAVQAQDHGRGHDRETRGGDRPAGQARAQAAQARQQARAQAPQRTYQAPQQQRTYQAPAAQERSGRDWNRGDRRSDTGATRSTRTWNQSAQAQAQTAARAQATTRDRSQSWGGRSTTRSGDNNWQRNRTGDNNWQRNRTYTDTSRNQTYRDGYRDGRRVDSRQDRQQTQNAYRSGYRDGNRTGYRDGSRYTSWNRDWRSNNRYNWYSYRNQYRDRYRLGRYYAPYSNYSYSRLSIGFRLGSLFFGSRYWINDPWQYRLPEAYGPYRWVRYYDDALLVDTYTGEVVDVIYDFFW
jgi:hypothetical protein